MDFLIKNGNNSLCIYSVLPETLKKELKKIQKSKNENAFPKSREENIKSGSFALAMSPSVCINLSFIVKQNIRIIICQETGATHDIVLVDATTANRVPTNDELNITNCKTLS